MIITATITITIIRMVIVQTNNMGSKYIFFQFLIFKVIHNKLVEVIALRYYTHKMEDVFLNIEEAKIGLNN